MKKEDFISYVNLNFEINATCLEADLPLETIREGRQKLYYWQHKHLYSFSDMVFDLCQKADAKNQRKLAKAFPEYLAAWYRWNLASFGDLDKLWQEWGIVKKEGDDPNHIKIKREDVGKTDC